MHFGTGTNIQVGTNTGIHVGMNTTVRADIHISIVKVNTNVNLNFDGGVVRHKCYKDHICTWKPQVSVVSKCLSDLLLLSAITSEQVLANFMVHYS